MLLLAFFLVAEARQQNVAESQQERGEGRGEGDRWAMPFAGYRQLRHLHSRQGEMGGRQAAGPKYVTRDYPATTHNVMGLTMRQHLSQFCLRFAAK